MDAFKYSLRSMLITVVILAFLGHAAQSRPQYVVDDYGAVGDGKTDDTQAFLKAWDAACAGPDFSDFIVNQKTYLLSTITFSGPCKGGVHVQISGTLVAPETPWETHKNNKWISFHNVSPLYILGPGPIDGRGSAWWSCHECPSAPDMFAIFECDNTSLSVLTLTNAPAKHLTVYNSVGVQIKGVNIVAPECSPNTDGMHIERCQHVEIDGCQIASGDDCIGIGGGTSDVNITDVICGPGHGISIGSLGRDGSEDEVQGVNVFHCQLNKTQNGVRIKTWQGGSGFVRGVTFSDINMMSVDVPIHIDQYYPSSGHKNQSSAVEISDVSFTGVVGTTSRSEGIDIACGESVPCTGISLQDINIRSDNNKTLTPRCFSAHAKTSGTMSPALTCDV